MSEKVYFLETKDGENISAVLKRIEGFLRKSDLFNFISEKDFVAVKTHFGEKKINGFKYI